VHRTARIRAGTPAPHGTVLRQGSAWVEFWPPGADLSGAPWLVTEAAFDSATRSWLATFDDTGLEKGTWTARASAEGPGPQGLVAGVSPYVTFTLG
jgi:hypothetical protein